MSTSGISIGSTASAPITFSGLASGLDTSSIISALMSAERQPVTRLTNEQAKLQGEQQQLQSVQGSLRQLALAASEFSNPALFETSQTVTSSEPSRVVAATSTGAAIGGHEVEVTQLANSAQRTFTFASPASEQELTIDGQALTVKAGESAKELASAINSSSTATVYAAVLEGTTIALSSRTTGNTGGEFIEVGDPGGVLSEQAGTAKEGKDAEYKIDGLAVTSSSNTVTNAIPGVTLTLEGLTSTGPVTIDVQPPGASVTAVETQVQAFVKLYNSTVEAIQKQLATKTVSKPKNTGELATGSLFGDSELGGLLNEMRQAMYEPIAGLPAEMSSPADIGLGAGAAAGAGASSQAAINGLLELNPAKLSEAVKGNPAGVQRMLDQWSQALQSTLTGVAEPGGTLEARINGEGTQISRLKTQINGMNEILAQREKALQQTYAKLEGIISQNSAQASWLSSQEALLTSSEG